MDEENRLLADLTNQIERHIHATLGGPAIPSQRVPTRHVTTRSGGSNRKRKAIPAIIVVDVPTAPLPSEDELRNILRDRDEVKRELHIYYIREDKQSWQLQEMELKPSDAEIVPSHLRFLENLAPDYVVLAKGQQIPTWLSEVTKVIPYAAGKD